MRATLLLFCAIVSTGCSAMIPKNSLSQADSPDLVCMSFPGAPREVAALLPLIAPIVAGFVVDQVSSALAVEAKKYTASYSGRGSNHLLKVSKPVAPATDPKVELAVTRIKIDRYYGDLPKAKGCPENLQGPGAAAEAAEIEKTKVMTFSADLALSASGDSIRITPVDFDLKRTKAKVSWFNSNVDLDVQLTLTSFIADDKGKIAQVDIGQVDFPLGKLELKDNMPKPALTHLRSGFIALPAFDYSKVKFSAGANESYIGPLNATITVAESDDFGDIIGKAAKTTSDNKDKIVNAILSALKIPVPTTK